jgi:hypothetical protein
MVSGFFVQTLPSAGLTKSNSGWDKVVGLRSRNKKCKYHTIVYGLREGPLPAFNVNVVNFNDD